jgi:hypothetical protein
MNWFRRLADVPGVPYDGSASIDRSTLARYNFEPTVSEFEYGGQVHRSLHWASPEGSTSTSPAHERAFAARDAAPREELRRLEETLELPGELSDYHFAIQGTCQAVFNQRRTDFGLLEKVERLCWLDVALVEAYPSIAEYEPGKFFRVVGYELLMRLYEGEGYFAEALEVAKRSAR